jgi:hypothetical protein
MDQGKEPWLVPETCLDTQTTSTMYHNIHIMPLIEILLVKEPSRSRLTCRKIRVQERVNYFQLTSVQQLHTLYVYYLVEINNSSISSCNEESCLIQLGQQLFHFLMNKINTLTKNWFHYACSTEVSKSNFNRKPESLRSTGTGIW